MSRIIEPGVFLAISGFCFAQSSPLPQNQASGEGYHIEVRRVIKHGAPGTAPLFEITFDYEFQNRSSIYVPGLGLAPAKGSFSYKIAEDRLEFMDGPNGRVIKAMTPVPTSAEMGVDSTDTPKQSDFAATARVDYWKTPLTGFPGTAAAVIQKYFPFGYVVQAIGNTNFYITHYRTLQTSDVQLRSQIALMISQPYAISADRLEYHIQIIARDRPRLSPTQRYGDDRSPLTLDAATKFVDQFIADLGNAGGQK
jgi:hypothetical protein